MTGSPIRYPELCADEGTTLQQFLDLYRAKVLRALVSVGDLRASAQPLLPANDLSIGGVVKHLARMEDLFFTHKLHGRPLPPPWDTAPLGGDPDWDFRTGRSEPIQQVRRLYESACRRSRSAAAEVSLDDLSVLRCFDRGLVTLRWIMVHMLEETAAHSGHLDLLSDVTAHLDQSQLQST